MDRFLFEGLTLYLFLFNYFKDLSVHDIFMNKSEFIRTNERNSFLFNFSYLNFLEFLISNIINLNAVSSL